MEEAVDPEWNEYYDSGIKNLWSMPSVFRFSLQKRDFSLPTELTFPFVLTTCSALKAHSSVMRLDVA